MTCCTLSCMGPAIVARLWRNQTLSMLDTALSAQQLPQDFWSFTAVTAPSARQSTAAAGGAALRPTVAAPRRPSAASMRMGRRALAKTAGGMSPNTLRPYSAGSSSSALSASTMAAFARQASAAARAAASSA